MSEEIGRDFVEQPNQFADELLMPRELVLKAVRTRPLEHGATDGEDEAFEVWIGAVAKKLGVSREAMTIRLSSLLA